ncbi:MAG: ABC transporter permease [Bdellovibrionales bacterium]
MSFFLSLGFFGWLTGESAKSSIHSYLTANAKQVLSADLTVSARRELKPEELKNLEEAFSGKGEWFKGYEFFGMMTTQDETRLVLVRVVTDSYPYYGELKLDTPGTSKDLQGLNLWAYQEFKSLSGLKVDQKVKLGEAEFTVKNFIQEDKTQTFRLASLAPRVFIHINDLEKTKMIQFGSTFTSTYFFKAEPKINLSELTTDIKKRLPDPAIDVTSFESLPDDESSPTQRLADFLGLTSLVALLFSALSLFYLLQVWSLEQQRERAFLFSSGVKKSQLFTLELLQSIIVSFLSTAVSVALLVLLQPFMEKVLATTMKSQFQLQFSWREVILVMACQLVLLIVMSNPWSQISRISILQLLKNNFATQQAGLKRFLPLFALLWPFSILASQSLRNGSYFFLSLLFISVSLVLFGKGFLYLLSKVKWKSWKLSLAAKSLNRQSTASWAFLFTVGLSSALLNLIPQIQGSLENLLSFDEIKSRPSLFLFDIQSEQWPDLELFLQEKSIEPTAVSPMVRGRIIKINDELYERKEITGFKSREEEEAARSRNRGLNMSYRSHQQSGERIIKGEPILKPFQEGVDQYPLLSIEKRYAGRMNLNIDDKVTFDIQGIEIVAKVANIREVKWSRFEPNFFVVMQSGVLEEAPQTRLASLPYLEKENRIQMIKDLAQKFSNISVIDVERLMESLIQNLKRVSGALNLMTYLTLLTGLLTLVFLLTAEAQRRGFEVHLVRILGSSVSDVKKLRLIEVTGLGLISILVGVGSSFIISYFIVDQIFQISFTPQIQPAIFIIISVLVVCWSITAFNTHRQLKANSFQYLKRDE